MELTLLITAIVILGAMNIALLYMLHTQAKTHNEQQSKAMKAVMSRNINDYIAATTAEKTANTPQAEPEEVLLTEADDTVFDKYIKSYGTS